MKSLLSILAILALFACAKKEDAVTAVPTTPEEINKAQTDAFGDVSALNIQQGEFVYTMKTQEVFSSQEPQATLLEEESLTITERVDYLDYVEFTLVKELVDHTQTDSPHFKFKDVLYLAKNPQPDEQPVDEEETDAPEVQDPNEVVVEYFNLKVVGEDIRKPAKVLEREPCIEGDGSCFIHVKKITYDIRVTVPPEPPQTSSVETWISQDVPYLAAVLKSCFRVVAIIDDSRPLVRQCTQVVDYKFQ